MAVLANFPGLGADTIDALLLTHGHADAILGMDDLRDLQQLEEVREEGKLIGYQLAHGMGAMRILSNRATLERVKETFPYLCNSVDFSRPGVLKRRVAWLEMEEVSDDNAAVEVAGLQVRFFPVWHGDTYVSLGFAFGTKPGGGHPFVYISDVKEVPPDTMEWLNCIAKVGIDLLVVDALHRKNHVSHFSLSEALAFLRQLRPKRALLVGMSSCEIGDHDEVNEELAALRESEGLDVQLAHDGMRLPELSAGCQVPAEPTRQKRKRGPSDVCAEGDMNGANKRVA